MTNPALTRRLGSRVRDLRHARGLTQEQLAERAGIVPAYVSSIERAVAAATVETLAAIAAALDVTLSELFVSVDRPLPRELPRLESALAAQSSAAQRTVLELVAVALRLVQAVPDRAKR
jgi:transcriptional regulator with XRE-family HTH domain